MFLDQGSCADLRSGTGFVNNAAQLSGGAISAVGASVSHNSVTFQDNQADGSVGGGVYVTGCMTTNASEALSAPK